MAVNQEILNIVEAIKAAVPAERIYLFGSYAYGTPNKDSDYDFYVIIPDGTITSSDAEKTIYKALARMGRRKPVDILAKSRREFDEWAEHPTLERKVKRDGIVLYESQICDTES